MKRFRIAMIATVCLALIVLPLVLPLSSHAQTPGQNLLTDGDFEASKWLVQDGIPQLQVAPGWRAWYLDIEQMPSYVKKPNNCRTSDLGCYWARPEYHEEFAELNPNRVHGGAQAQQYYSYGRMHEAGLYQQVIGIQPGATLRFSIYMQAWMCYQIDACGKGGIRSDAPSDMHLRVGIDPYGGTDPLSANIIWSPETPAFDHWAEFAVEAEAKGDTMTVFTHSRADWDWARTNNDVYLDDASLVVVEKGQPSATVAPTTIPGSPAPSATLAPTTIPGSPAPTPTLSATGTPRPDGAIIHVVRPGDTMSAISLEYDVPLDELYRLNNLTRTSILSIGQEIIVKVPQGAVITQATATAPAQATATLQAETTVTLTITPTVTLPTLTPTVAPTDTPIPQGLCLSAFDDLNDNTLRDGNEPGLAGVTFSILSSGSEVARYATDSSGLPYCLTQLPPGTYSVQVQLPAGYVAAFEKADVTLTLGQRVSLDLAAHKGEQPTPTVMPTAEAQPVQPAVGRSNTTLVVLILIAAAILLIVVAAIVAIRRGR